MDIETTEFTPAACFPLVFVSDADCQRFCFEKCALIIAHGIIDSCFCMIHAKSELKNYSNSYKAACWELTPELSSTFRHSWSWNKFHLNSELLSPSLSVSHCCKSFGSQISAAAKTVSACLECLDGISCRNLSQQTFSLRFSDLECAGKCTRRALALPDLWLDLVVWKCSENVVWKNIVRGATLQPFWDRRRHKYLIPNRLFLRYICQCLFQGKTWFVEMESARQNRLLDQINFNLKKSHIFDVP